VTSNKPAAEVTISHDLIHTMLKEFVPELADLPLTLHGEGWDNEIHRLGDHHAVRLPRREAAALLIENEQRWLPDLGPTLPLAIPVPTHAGKPAFGFPWHWSIVPWLPGIPFAHVPRPATGRLIEDLSQFLNALHVPAPDDAPHNPVRGVALTERADSVHERIDAIPDVDGSHLHELWDELVDTPEWGGEPMWLHGDLHPLNILVRGGHISAVIDFGDITAGDPATDLSVAWMVFDDDARTTFRKQLAIDGRSIDVHTWNRARAWALSHATACLANSADDPTMRRIGEDTLLSVLG
jgi:aminoglycoside phosphotransferase (APT) family kinase protein